MGESERAVRQVFERARNSAPCVIFFDELDALCAKRSLAAEVHSLLDSRPLLAMGKRVSNCQIAPFLIVPQFSRDFLEIQFSLEIFSVMFQLFVFEALILFKPNILYNACRVKIYPACFQNYFKLHIFI